jgi:thymidylate synthase (FAD)
MFLVNPSFEIMQCHPDLETIERAGRICYKSESLITPESAAEFVRKRAIESGHESMLEHSILTVKVVTDRGVSHEITRHRQTQVDDDLFITDMEWDPGISQESTRFCNYGKKGAITFVIPPWVAVEPGEFTVESFIKYSALSRAEYIWLTCCQDSEKRYLQLLEEGWKPQMARDVLPISTKTEIVMSANWRQWRHFLRLRTAPDAHPQMRQLFIPLRERLSTMLPAIFQIMPLCQGCGKPSSGMCAECKEIARMHSL